VAFSRDEYVKECRRKAAAFRRLAASIAICGAVLFAVVWVVERQAATLLLGIDPAAAIISSVCLAGVAAVILVGEHLDRRTPPSSSL
jgi:hypothetical protein